MRLVTKKLLLILLVSTHVVNSACAEDKSEFLRVACVGDSITFGARVKNRDQHSYPAVLQSLLGQHYKVNNFGVGGCTLIRKGRPNVWSSLEKIKQSKPDIVIISLGTNDTCGGRRACWDHHDEFPQDLRDLIDSFHKLDASPQIWLCLPTPMALSTPGLSAERMADLQERAPRLQELIRVIKSIAEEKQVHLLDLHSPLENRPELFTAKDGVHPNRQGYAEIARLVHTALKPQNKK